MSSIEERVKAIVAEQLDVSGDAEPEGSLAAPYLMGWSGYWRQHQRPWPMMKKSWSVLRAADAPLSPLLFPTSSRRTLEIWCERVPIGSSLE